MLRYEDEDFVNIPVPTSRVAEVYHLLGMPPGKEMPDKQKPLRENGSSKWWPQERIALLKHEMTNPSILALLDLAAEQLPPGWASTKCAKNGKLGRESAGRSRKIDDAHQAPFCR